MNTLYRLIERIKNDDQYAIEELFIKYTPLMRKLIFEANVPTKEQKDELMHILLIRTWTATKAFKLDRVDSEDNIESVFYKYMERVIYNQISNTKRHYGVVMGRVLETLSLDYEYGEDEDGDMYERLKSSKNIPFDDELIDSKYLFSIIKRLDEDSQKIIYLYYYRRYTDERIGHLFNVSRNTINIKRRKALTRMKNLIIDDRKKQTAINNRYKKKQLNIPKKPILMIL